MDVREAYGSIEYEKVLDEVEKKFQLHIDQAGALSNEVFLLMLGLTQPQEFTGKVKSAVNVSDEIAKQVSQEVNEKIFRPIRTSLMKIHKMVDEKEEQEESGEVSSGESESEETKVAETEASEKKLEPEKINIAEEKLKKTFSIPKKDSGYAGKDPYHEEVA